MLALPAGAFAQADALAPVQAPAKNQSPAQNAPEMPAPVPAPAQAPPAPEPAQRPTRGRPTPENRRHSVRMMEAVLSRAVLGGAEQLAELLGNGSPNVSFFTGQARAHGFVLDGYGVFFHVEIPEMQQSLVMSVTSLERDEAVASTLQSLRRAMSGMPDGAAKLQEQQAVSSKEATHA